MAINPGKYNRKITIKRPSNQTDEYGHSDNAWVDVMSIYAAIEELRGQEFHTAKQTNTEIVARIRTRHRDGIKHDMRVHYGTKIYEIASIINPVISKGEMQIMVREIL